MGEEVSGVIQDEYIISLFFDRSERAIEALADAHGRAMRAVSLRIVQNEQDADECLNDAYLGVWNAIPPARPTALGSFACRICRNISLTRYHYNKAARRDTAASVSLEEIADVLPDDRTVEREMDNAAITQALNDFLGGLNPTNLYVFMRRYWFFDAVRDIAGTVGLTEAAVYLRLDRMKKSLAKHLKERGILI
ncbi:MAG: sigma-70 family RNA polymerase sigma factor [Ruminococcaceae bacterium]|nr:sigma-70 family RNA polymerase sigma factor [Oscillospiraceae bacterium]